MIRGTTPTYTFVIGDLDPSIIKDIEISFYQDGLKIDDNVVNRLDLHMKVNEPEKSRVSLTDNKEVTCRLEQKETFGFSVGSCQVQMRVLTSDGKVLASEIARVKVEPSLSSDILGG